MLIKLQGFGGMIPVSGDRALPDGFAVESVNTWFYGQELIGVRAPLDVTQVSSSTRKVLRIPKAGDPAWDLDDPDNVWKLFTDPDTDFAFAPVVKDDFKRIYWASPTTGARYNTYANLQSGLVPEGFRLGYPQPPTAPGGTAAGGAAPAETRVYLYTWISAYGEEGPPSPPFTLAGNTSGTWNVTGVLDPTAAQTTALGFAAFKEKVLYRTITSDSGVATYFRVTKLAPGVTTFADTVPGTVLAGNLQLESTTWAPAPFDPAAPDDKTKQLQGLIAMPNGFLIGWIGKDIYFSEAYHPHAWPAEYIVSTEYPVVGMGVVGQTCVVCTQGFPSTLTGIKPGATMLAKSTSNEPCLSRGSIVSTPNGVIYASQNGLVLAISGGFNNITEKLITRDEWIRNYQPHTLRAARHQNGYLALRAVADITKRSAFFLDPSNLQVALTEFSTFEFCYSIFPDVWSGDVLLLQDDDGPLLPKIKRWDPPTVSVPGGASSDNFLPIRWKSKEFALPKQVNFAAYSIYWDDARYFPNDIDIDVIPRDQKVRFLAWANRRLVYDQEVPRNGRPVRLPSGYKSDIWQFEIRARAPVYTVHISTSARELAGV